MQQLFLGQTSLQNRVTHGEGRVGVAFLFCLFVQWSYEGCPFIQACMPNFKALACREQVYVCINNFFAVERFPSYCLKIYIFLIYVAFGTFLVPKQVQIQPESHWNRFEEIISRLAVAINHRIISDLLKNTKKNYFVFLKVLVLHI